MAENAENTAPLASSEPSDKKSAEIPPGIPAGNQTASSPAPHEHDSRSEDTSKNSFGERLFDAAGGVFEKFQLPFKKGRGRPRNDGKPGKADIVGPVLSPMQPTASQPAATPMAVVGTVDNQRRVSVFAKFIDKTVDGIRGVGNMFVRQKGRIAGLDREFINGIIRDAEPTQKDRDDLTESLDDLCKKYNYAPKYCEELAVAANAVKVLVAPYAAIIVTLNAEIERQRREKEKSGK